MSASNNIYLPKRIFDRLKSIYTEKLTVLCAPENYGKTTLLREFVRLSCTSERSCHIINDNHSSANECFARYCEVLLGSAEQIPITEKEFFLLRDKFEAVHCSQPPIFLIDSPSAVEMVLNNLYCFRLITAYSPACTVITCEELTFYHQMLVEHNNINLIGQNELSLTAEETDEYFKICGIKGADAALVHSEVHGEMLRKEFLALESIREKSQFRTQKYQFFMRPVWESEMHVAILCESKLLHQRTTPEKSYHRLSHVWNRKENTILPPGQVVELFQKKAALKTVGFRPDGIYPEADSIVFFRNPRDREGFREIKIPMADNQTS